MRSSLTSLLNNRFVRFLRGVGKWSLLFLLAALAGVTVSTRVVIPKITNSVVAEKGVRVTHNADGQEEVVFQDDKTPKNYDDELSVGAPQLIYENQARAQPSKDSRAEDHSLDQVSVPGAERDRLVHLLAGFLHEWESFKVGETDGAYQRRLQPYADLTRIDDLVRRRDNMQDEAVSRDGVSGSQLASYSDPGGRMRVLRYSSNSAYVASTGEVLYTGPALSWQGRKVIRAYALVLTRFRSGWRVSRAAAQTQGPIIE
jgi:hypothetical protein